MTWRTFFIGLGITLVSPVLVVLVLALMAGLANRSVPDEVYATQVEPAMVWPWEDTAYLHKFQGDQLERGAPKPIDLMFIVDVSGSVRPSMTSMATAVSQLIEALDQTRPGLLRFGLMRFDTEARVDVPFGAGKEQIYERLNNLAAFTNGNTPDAMFAELRKLDTSFRPDARRIGIFYTDGYLCSNGSTTENDAEVMAAALKRMGWEFFSVGIPNERSSGLMVRITGSPNRVFEAGNKRDLSRNLGILGQTILESAGQVPRFSAAFDGRHVDVPLQGRPWQWDNHLGVVRQLAVLPFDTIKVGHPLKPKRAGFWRVGVEPAHLMYLDMNQKPTVLRPRNRPTLLVITWFTFFLMLLPALLWCLSQWPQKLPARLPMDRPVIPVRRRPRVLRLPPLPNHPRPRKDLVPTLFMGLGPESELVLDAIAWELEQADNGFHQMPYRFLQLDVVKRPVTQAPSFRALEKREVKKLYPEPTIAHAEQYLPKGPIPPHLAWFPISDFRDHGRQRLDLAGEGAREDRALSRLALFQWLEQPALVKELKAALENLRVLPCSDEVRQIVLVGSWRKGIGSGCMVDIARICQRLNRDWQAGEVTRPIPDIHFLLFDIEGGQDQPNRRGLIRELQTISLAGCHPTRVTLVPGDSILDRVDAETPFQRVFSVEGRSDLDAAAQCGQWAVMMTELTPRNQMLASARHLAESEAVACKFHGIHVVPGLTRDRVARELLLQLLGPDVLVELEPTLQGAYTVKVPAESHCQNLLQQWEQEEPSGTVLRGLLQTIREADPLSLVGAMLQPMIRVHDDREDEALALFEDLEKSLIQRVNEKLHGAVTPRGWRRTWFPIETAALLGYMSLRLRDLATAMGGSSNHHASNLELLAGKLVQLRHAMDKWIQTLVAQCSGIAAEIQAVAARSRVLDELPCRSYVSDQRAEHPAASMVTHSAERCLRRWLKTKNTLSPLQQHTYFELKMLGSEPRVSLVLALMEKRRFLTAAPAVAHLREICQRLTADIPSGRISGGLTALSEARRKVLAEGLMDRSGRVREALVCLPEVSDWPDQEREVMAAFSRVIAQPADHGWQRQTRGNDQAALRRVEFSLPDLVVKGVANVVQIPERVAERMASAIEHSIKVEVDTLPPDVRLALADREGFRAFSQAFRSGIIRKTVDELSQPYWACGDCRLTYSRQPNLAEAALAFSRWTGERPGPPLSVDKEVLFKPLNDWLEEGKGNQNDALILAVIQLETAVTEGTS